MAERRERGERAGEGGRGGAAAGRAEAQGLGAQAERAAGRIRHAVPFPQHTPATQLRRPGPAATVKTRLHPEPAALRPRPYRRGKKITLAPPDTRHVTIMLDV